MNSNERRLRTIYLSLTPQQIVGVWLRNALQAGTLEDAARHSPPYRGAVANTVLETVRNSMKGEAEPLIERAILQARQEADLLYNLALSVNVEVIENRVQRDREYILLLSLIGAECRGKTTEQSIEVLRLAVLMFLESVIIFDAAIAQVAVEHLNGQSLLFRDTAIKLAEQLQMASDLSTWFNELAVEVGAAEINLEELRNSLQSETGRRIPTWVSLARVEMLSLFGTTEEAKLRGGPWWRTTPQNLSVELPEFLHFSVVQHFSTSEREHASQCLLQLLICVSV
jgi:hypothetical protein